MDSDNCWFTNHYKNLVYSNVHNTKKKDSTPPTHYLLMVMVCVYALSCTDVITHYILW